jgi:hypothetical protein
MPREAKLFSSRAGSVVRGYLKFRANISPRWIRNARASRKRIEPAIVRSLSALNRARKKLGLGRRVAYGTQTRNGKPSYTVARSHIRKENFYLGIRILLELQRDGSSGSVDFLSKSKPSLDCWQPNVARLLGHHD